MQNPRSATPLEKHSHDENILICLLPSLFEACKDAKAEIFVEFEVLGKYAGQVAEHEEDMVEACMRCLGDIGCDCEWFENFLYSDHR